MWVVERDLRGLVGVGTDVDDLRTHSIEQQVGQRERAEEVCAQGDLETVNRLAASLGNHTGVVDEDVHVAVEEAGERSHRSLIGEIEFHHRRVAADLRGTLCAQLEVANRQDHLGASTGERPRRRQAHTIGGAGNDDALAAQISQPRRRPLCCHQQRLASAPGPRPGASLIYCYAVGAWLFWMRDARLSVALSSRDTVE